MTWTRSWALPSWPWRCSHHRARRQAARGGVAAAAAAAAPRTRPAPPPPQQLPPARPTATLQRLLAQLATVRRQMHEANGGQGEVFNLAEHMAPPLEAVKPKIA